METINLWKSKKKCFFFWICRDKIDLFVSPDPVNHLSLSNNLSLVYFKDWNCRLACVTFPRKSPSRQSIKTDEIFRFHTWLKSILHFIKCSAKTCPFFQNCTLVRTLINLILAFKNSKMIPFIWKMGNETDFKKFGFILILNYLQKINKIQFWLCPCLVLRKGLHYGHLQIYWY